MYRHLVVHIIFALADLAVFMGFSIETVVFPMSPEIVAEMRSRFKHNEGNTEYKDCFPKVECYEGSSCYDPARDTVCIFKIHPTTCTCNTTKCTAEDWSHVSPLTCEITSVNSAAMGFVFAYVLVGSTSMGMLFGIVERRVQLLRANQKEIPLTMILLGGWHLISIIFNLAIKFHKTAPQDRFFHVEWFYFLTQGWLILFNALCFYDLTRLLNMPTNRVTPALQMRDGSPPRPPPPDLGGDGHVLCMNCNTNHRDLMLLPCCHTCYCQSCGANRSSCPVCFVAVLNVKPIAVQHTHTCNGTRTG
jgi:hypothetical protein